MTATEAIQCLLDHARIDLQRAEFWGALGTITYYEGRVRAFEDALRAIKKTRRAGEVRDRASDGYTELPPGKET